MQNPESIEHLVDELNIKKFGKRKTRALIQDIQTRYDEPERFGQPKRYYHVFKHPLSMFDIFQEHKSLVSRPDAVGWSILVHDVFYNPKAAHGINERKSAEFGEAVLPHPLGKMVAHFTLATAEHQTTKVSPNLAFFLDLDLSILGAPRPAYQNYAVNVRKEYEHVPTEEYKTGRIDVLENLSKRVDGDGIYQTEFFRETYAQPAAENIAWELDSLKLSQ